MVELFSGDNKSYEGVALASLASIMQHVKVKLIMDPKTLDYYYGISVDEFLDSDMPDDLAEDMAAEGWHLNDIQNLLRKWVENKSFMDIRNKFL